MHFSDWDLHHADVFLYVPRLNKGGKLPKQAQTALKESDFDFRDAEAGKDDDEDEE